MVIERSTTIARPIAAVFDFVSDARNDPIWCAKVKAVEPCDHGVPAPGSRYRVTHRPIPLLPARLMQHTLLAWDPPHHIEWHEDDGHDVFDVTYLLTPDSGKTRFAQRSEAQLAAPRFVHPLMRAGIGHDIAAQLKRLRRHLEAS